jgi:PleD family two-component response regulator
VLIDGEIADTAAFGERLRATIADRTFEHDAVALRVTISGGFVSAGSRGRGGVNEMLAAADRLLYEAKAAGRNRILFGPDTETPAAKRSIG